MECVICDSTKHNENAHGNVLATVHRDSSLMSGETRAIEALLDLLESNGFALVPNDENVSVYRPVLDPT